MKNNLMVCHGEITHKEGVKCETCDKVKKEFGKVTLVRKEWIRQLDRSIKELKRVLKNEDVIEINSCLKAIFYQVDRLKDLI